VYYNNLYSNAKFQNLWGTLHYLNQKGITSGIAISFMGRVPPWMGGIQITSSLEAEWVEMMATFCYYAINTENVRFDILDPINEPDWDGFEGPQVGAVQYTRLLQKLSDKLDAMGLGNLRFLGPNTANLSTGLDTYMPQMMGNATVMSKVDHFGFHNYSGSTGGADAVIKSSAYSSKNFWMTETWAISDVMAMIGQNAASVQIWDAYDAVYNHAILAGRGSTPPNDNGQGLPLIAYNSSTGTYTPRQQFYQAEQIFKFVPSGSIRIAATESNSSLTMYAFRHPASGRLTLVGRNTSASTIAINGTLNGLPSVSPFQFYQTDVANNNFLRGSDVVVTNGSFFFRAPVNSYFTLTTPVP
jgi:O-glycosyl hydrolase